MRSTATINQIRAFLIEQGIAVRKGAQALRRSLFTILDLRRDEISERMHDIIIGLYEDWLWLDERIENLTDEIEVLSDQEAHCIRPQEHSAIGPIISTATVSAIGTGEAFDRGRDFAAWMGSYRGNTVLAASRSSDACRNAAANICARCSFKRHISY